MSRHPSARSARTKEAQAKPAPSSLLVVAARVLLAAVATALVAGAGEWSRREVLALVLVAALSGVVGGVAARYLDKRTRYRFAAEVPYGVSSVAVVAFATYGTIDSLLIGLGSGLIAGLLWRPLPGGE